MCVVTKWSEWSECTGNCQYGLQVRNRDVLRPPFPEIDFKTSEEFIRPCPSLYESRTCQPTECLLNKRFESNVKRTQFSLTNDDIFRDLPIIRSVTSDTGKSPFEFSDKALRQIRKKVVPSPVKTTSQPHRPNCKYNLEILTHNLGTLEMTSQCCRIVRDECPDNSVPKRLIRWFRLVCDFYAFFTTN